jgi:hypothetical protein
MTRSPPLATSTERRRRKKMKQMKKMVSKKERLVVLVVEGVALAAMVMMLAEEAEEMPAERVKWEEGLEEAGMVEVLAEGVMVAGEEVKEEEVVTLVQQRKIQRKIPSHYPLPAHPPLRPLRPSHVPLHRDPRQQPR